MASSYLDLPIGEFLDLVASRRPAPGGGSVAAVAVSLSASLVEMAARYSVGQLADAERSVADAALLRARSAELADSDARAYRKVVAAYAADDEESGLREARIRAALTVASEAPLEIAEVGSRTAKLAALLAAHGNPHLRGDAVTALRLAEAAVVSAAHLVAVNVSSGGGDEGLVRRAEGCVRLAREAASEVAQA